MVHVLIFVHRRHASICMVVFSGIPATWYVSKKYHYVSKFGGICNRNLAEWEFWRNFCQNLKAIISAKFSEMSISAEFSKISNELSDIFLTANIFNLVNAVGESAFHMKEYTNKIAAASA